MNRLSPTFTVRKFRQSLGLVSLRGNQKSLKRQQENCSFADAQVLWICNISRYFLFLYFLQGFMEFKDFLYVQVSITLHYFIFGLGFIQIFLHNIPSVSDICLCNTEYCCLFISHYLQTSIEIFSYISIQPFIPLHLFQVSATWPCN